MPTSETGHPRGVVFCSLELAMLRRRATASLLRLHANLSTGIRRGSPRGWPWSRRSPCSPRVMSDQPTLSLRASWGVWTGSRFAFCGSCDACQTARVVPRHPATLAAAGLVARLSLSFEPGLSSLTCEVRVRTRRNFPSCGYYNCSGLGLGRVQMVQFLQYREEGTLVDMRKRFFTGPRAVHSLGIVIAAELFAQRAQLDVEERQIQRMRGPRPRPS